jgi:hypothetical protein
MTSLLLILAALASITVGGLAAAAAHRRLPLAGITLALSLIAALIFAGAVAKRSGATTTRGSRCHITTRDSQPGPDPTCTPGSARPLNRRTTCRSKTRPDLPQAVHDRILRDYGVPNWTGQDGELDHRVPFFLGGRTTIRNVWPEPGSIPNTKDRLEFRIYTLVCQDRTMTPRYARRLFLRDWRDAYDRYIMIGTR